MAGDDICNIRTYISSNNICNCRVCEVVVNGD